MRFAFSEEQLELRSTVRQVLERECTAADLRALAAGWPAGQSPPRSAGSDPGRSGARWAVLAELGALGLLVPERLGGLGLDETDLVGVLEEAGRVAVPEPLAESAGMVVPLLAEVSAAGRGGVTSPGAAARSVDDWLATLVGGAVSTVGGVEVGRGGAVVTTETSAGRARTPRVVGAGTAELAVLVSGSANDPEIHVVEVRGGWEPTPSVDATRLLGDLHWSPSDESRVASGATALGLVEGLVDRGAMLTAAQLLGLADRMITMAAAYAAERHQFGRPIGSFQAVKHLLANARVRLEFARPATYRAAESIARRRPGRGEHAAMAKALAAEAADLAASVALQVHGAIGYTWECDLHLYMKRAWALSAVWGDARTQRARVLAAAVAERAARRPG